ncbi:MAG TPA: hypothetical protein VIN10_03725 [Bacteroidales bacterium]
MKTLNFTLIITFVFGIGFSSCNKSTTPNPINPQGKLPDATVSGTISGDVNEQFSYKLPEQGGTEGAALGAYSSADNYLTFTFTVTNSSKAAGNKTFNISSNSGNLAKGTYAANIGGLADVGNGWNYGEFVSGSITIDKVELYMNAAGGTSLHWVSGSTTYVLQDDSTPPKQVTISCNFSNVYTSKQ